MIKLEHTDVYGFEPAIRGARNPMNSWSRSDSKWEYTEFGTSSYVIGENDHKLLLNLAKAGPDHGKYLRFIQVYVDITGPLYWYKELDTYRMGVEKNSCSTMHKIQAKQFEIEDFSFNYLVAGWYDSLVLVVAMLNDARKKYLNSKSKKDWWQMIQLLPSSYNQRRTYLFSYAALRNIYKARKNHKLDEWRDFCSWIESLPYSELITNE